MPLNVSQSSSQMPLRERLSEDLSNVSQCLSENLLMSLRECLSERLSNASQRTSLREPLNVSQRTPLGEYLSERLSRLSESFSQRTSQCLSENVSQRTFERSYFYIRPKAPAFHSLVADSQHVHTNRKIAVALPHRYTVALLVLYGHFNSTTSCYVIVRDRVVIHYGSVRPSIGINCPLCASAALIRARVFVNNARC